MQRLSFWVLSLLYVSSLWASPVSLEKAMIIAKDYLKGSETIQLQVANMNVAHRSMGIQSPEEKDIYVFNINSSDGFIIVSGDDATVPVLGYCDHGHFDYDTAPSNLRWWLDFYMESIQQIRVHDTQNESYAVSSNRPTDVIQPLIMTKWDQSYPYNIQCPVYQGQHCPTGCLATALAQVMYYHKHPQDSCKSIPGYHVESINQNLSALPSVTFDWDSMKHRYGNNDSEKSRNAVAQLMCYCGQLVKMEYTPSSSGAVPYMLPQELPNSFHYANTIHHLYRVHYSIGQWDEILLSELKNLRPVLYFGYTSENEGHAFVCDGYDGNGMYHINWGWSGSADGYYRISVLDANESGIGGSTTSSRFSVDQSILMGVHPIGEDDYVPISPTVTITTKPSLVSGGIYSRDDITETFKDVKIGTILSMSNESSGWWGANKSVGYGLYDEDGQLVNTIAQTTLNFWNNYETKYIAHIKNLGNGIENGHYIIKPIVYESECWQPVFNSDKYHINVEINGLHMTLTTVPQARFEVSSVKKIGKNVVLSLENPDEEFNGMILLLKMNNQGEYVDIAYENMSLEAESKREISIYLGNNSLNLENDVFAFSVDPITLEPFYTNVYSKNSQVGCEMKVLNMNESNNTVYGDRVLCQIELFNTGQGKYHHFLHMTLVDENDVERAGGFRQIMDLTADGSTMLNVELPVSSFDVPLKVKIGTYDSDGNKTDSYSDVFNVAKGAYYWTADGSVLTQEASSNFNVPKEALAISLRNAYTSNVKANSNPNTIYLLDKTVPKGLKGKNIVNYENKSGSLSLTDGYSYLIPCTINITGNVTYHRTFAADEVNRWTSICLPFSPTDISASGQSLSRFMNSDEEGKDVWLMEWTKIEDDKAYFDYACDFNANTPYLISVNASYQDIPLQFTANKVNLAPNAYVDATVQHGNYYFQGFNSSDNYTGLYSLRDNCFVLNTDMSLCEPFRASFINFFSDALPIIYIQAIDITDGITSHNTETSVSQDAIFNIAGQRMPSNDIKKLPKGMYIINGKKYVKR
jgi:hypothetical protein